MSFASLPIQIEKSALILNRDKNDIPSRWTWRIYGPPHFANWM